ncbi:MAG: hypothetical protein ACOZQL_40430 [Myxococcota bacterium]
MSAAPLKLVGPWWSWQRQLDAGLKPRASRPWIQKFDRPDFVEGFLAQPQRSLKFTREDHVFTFATAKRSVLGEFTSRVFKPEQVKATEVGPVRVNTGVKKLFLDIHRRYYAVVVELRSDERGLPCRSRDDVCQAGFVVRRRHLSYERAHEAAAKKLVLDIAQTQRDLADLTESRPLPKWAARQRAARVKKLLETGALASVQAELLAKLAAQRAELLQWKADAGAHVVEEAWRPSDFDGVGAWAITEGTPKELDEQWYPLYPLLADDAVPDHDATCHSLYFGVIPTSALETDAAGTPRFDSDARYQLRCFVRRHEAECPRSDAAPDCCGDLFWSEPSEPYQLAAAPDLVGTSQRPVTIQMPDLRELEALSGPGALARFSPMRVVQPQTLKPLVEGGVVTGGMQGGAAICFFAIPLITIVAFFVFSIFLPIVVFLFSLWFLLAFRFCIPPSFSLSGALTAELDAALAAPDLDLSLSVDVRARFANELNWSLLVGAGLRQDPVTGLVYRPTATGGEVLVRPLPETPAPKAPPRFEATDPVGLLTRSLATVQEAKVLGEELRASGSSGLDLVAGLEWEPRVTTAPEAA